LEESPEMPLMMLIDHEALEVFEQISRYYPHAHLVMMSGIRYITITDAALEHILERLERERIQFAKTVERYCSQQIIQKGIAVIIAPVQQVPPEKSGGTC